MNSDTNEKNKPEWPPFEKLDAYIFPDWLKASAVEFIDKYRKSLNGIYIGLFATACYDDNNNISCKGEAWVNFNGKKPSEDELDFIPSMRRIERRSSEMWDYLPIDADEEGNLNGEFGYGISREGIYYCYDEADRSGEATYTAKANYDGHEWQYEECITIPSTITETALAAMDVESILSQINPSNYSFKEWPSHELVEIRYNEDEEVIDIIVKGGGLFQNYERKIA